MIFLLVTIVPASILFQSLFGPALRAVKDPNFSDIVAESFKVNVDSSPLETLTNALKPYFEDKLFDDVIASDLFAFIKLETVPEDFKPLLFQSYSYLAHYTKERNDKSMLEQLFYDFKSRNNNVYAELLETAKQFIENDPSDLPFLFRIVDLFEKTYIADRPGSDEFSIFLLRKLQKLDLTDVKHQKAQKLVLQVHMLNTSIKVEYLKMRKWFFSNSVMATYPDVKNHMLKLGKELAEKEPLAAYAILYYFGVKMTRDEQEPFMKLMLKSEKLDLRGAAVAKQLGWVEEYKTILKLYLGKKDGLPPALEATFFTFDDFKKEILIRAALDLWSMSMEDDIYSGKDQNFEELTNEYYATLNNQTFDFNDIIRMHVKFLAKSKSEAFASAIRMYLKNHWPIEVLEPLFGRVMKRFDEYGVHSLYNLMNEFPELIELKDKYLEAVRTMSQMPLKVHRSNSILKEQLILRNFESTSLALVVLHVLMLAGNEKVELNDLRQMDWDAISKKYRALPALKPLGGKPMLKKKVVGAGETK